MMEAMDDDSVAGVRPEAGGCCSGDHGDHGHSHGHSHGHGHAHSHGGAEGHAGCDHGSEGSEESGSEEEETYPLSLIASSILAALASHTTST